MNGNGYGSALIAALRGSSPVQATPESNPGFQYFDPAQGQQPMQGSVQFRPSPRGQNALNPERYGYIYDENPFANIGEALGDSRLLGGVFGQAFRLVNEAAKGQSSNEFKPQIARLATQAEIDARNNASAPRPGVRSLSMFEFPRGSFF